MATFDASGRIGSLIPIEAEGRRLSAYLPKPLPLEPPLQLGPRLQHLLQDASLRLGRLDGAAGVLPNRDLLVQMYLRKEATLTSQIEGTVATLEDLLLYEEAPVSDNYEFREMTNHTAALQAGLKSLRDGRPLDVQLIEVMHGQLLRTGRGSHSEPGKLRRKQNFVGGRRLLHIPPPPEHVSTLMQNLIEYVKLEATTSPLVCAAVAHAQFETIHPFMDGNGRLGRMLITLIFCQAGLIRWPMLFPSLYLKQNRREYFELLTDLREHGDWESWLDFFLEGISSSAQSTADNALAISDLIQADRANVESRLAGSAVLVYSKLLIHPATTAGQLAGVSGLSEPTVRKALDNLIELGICSETTGGQRYRRYRYDAYLDLLNAGTEIEAA